MEQLFLGILEFFGYSLMGRSEGPPKPLWQRLLRVVALLIFAVILTLLVMAFGAFMLGFIRAMSS